MESVVDKLLGLAVTVAVGELLFRFFDCMVRKPTKPDSITDEEWEAFFRKPSAGNSIGRFERVLFFGAFAAGKYEIIAGWLVFKLGAKWESWRNVVQVPTTIDGIKPLTCFQMRHAYGSWLLSRFLLGTLINILIGAFGWLCAKQINDLMASIPH